jgi:AcrR family transcriptional regulator
MSNEIAPDGRNARRDISRRKLLLAGLRMVEKGDFRFSLQDVADRADMHRRSIHDIFGNFDNYLEELLAEHEASIQAAVHETARKKEISLARLVLIGRPR